ncbi:ABC transporter ATP-binding protein [Paenibacillus marinisediminis]
MLKKLRFRKQPKAADESPVQSAEEQRPTVETEEDAPYITQSNPANVQHDWPVRDEYDPEKPLLEVQSVTREFEVGGNTLHVLKGIDMEVRSGQLVILRGRSGSGKTTLLNMLGGLDLPTQGEIRFRGETLSEWNDDKRTITRRSDIGFIFQAYALMPMLSAYENVELSLRMAKIPRHLWDKRVRHCLDLVGLGKRMNHRPFEMSGGEQQRVAIAKAVAHKPLLLLADEPTANLDTQTVAQVMGVFQHIIRTENISICMATHDPTILEVADHVYEMVDGRFVS